VISRGFTAGSVVEEIAKLPAFFRRDLLVMWSYRLALFGDWFNLIVQVVIFYFVGKLISPSSLPRFDGTQPTYVEFVVTGIVPTAFLVIGISRVVAVIRQEQYMGTLEPLLIAPIAPATLQLGSVLYDLLYVPIRSTAFLALAAAFFDIRIRAAGLGPAAAVLIVFIPFVWGLGMMSSAGVLTFKRGAGAVTFAGTVLTIASGTYFPLNVFPSWVQTLAGYNPVAKVLEATRSALIGDAGWSEALGAIMIVLPSSLVVLTVGLIAFDLALTRERRRGTLGMY
jgi:ABC-2 type transport system permease protein